MDNKQKYLILKTVQDNNILPITSKCNLKCKFCSHFQNPPGLEVDSYGNLNFDFIKEMVDFLPKEGAVILGESATKIIEGEPLYHPDIKKILIYLRNSWPNKEIRITTNGSFLSEDIIKLLIELGNVKLNISLNCANPSERKYLMEDQNGEQVFLGIKKLFEHNISYSGSIVALPHIMSWKSIEDTAIFLDKYMAETIRVFMPAFTDYSRDEMKYNLELYSELNKFVNNLNKKIRTPVIFEPPFLNNLSAVIEGIIINSPADNTDLNTGDIIEYVNNKKIISRVDAFSKIQKLADPELAIRKQDDSYQKIKILKEKNQKSGIVMHYDISPHTIEILKQKIRKHNPTEVVLITSQLAKNIINYLVENKLKNIFSDKRFSVLDIKNNFFGGSIITAGLLTVNDIKKELKKYDFKSKKNNLIIIPGIIFDEFGKDLIGNNIKEISNFFDLEVELI